MEKREGGPSKWEAHAVRPENEPQLWFVFVSPSLCPPATNPHYAHIPTTSVAITATTMQ